MALALLDSLGEGPTSIALYAAAGVGVVTAATGVALARRGGQDRMVVDRAASRDADLPSYVVTYILPFLGLSLHSGRERAAVGIVFGLLALLYVQNGLFYVNPLLALFGLRLFDIDCAGDRYVLLTRRDHVRTKTVIRYHRISHTVLVEGPSSAAGQA